jgi:hypothetical protein
MEIIDIVDVGAGIERHRPKCGDLMVPARSAADQV